MKRAIVLSALACGSAVGSRALAQAWEPARDGIAAFGGMVYPDRIIVQFEPDGGLRVVGGRLEGVPAGRNAGALPRGTWARVHSVDDNTLRAMRATAEANLGEPMADLTQNFELVLAPGSDLAASIDAVRAFPGVVYAIPSALPAPPTLPPNYQPQQRYLNPATDGIGASSVWAWPGGTGAGVRVVDVEYSWNTAHLDLPAVIQLGATGVDPFNSTNHGTAVLGQMLSRNNGWGTTGAVYDAVGYIAYANFSSGYNLPGALSTAAAGMRAGDVILIEQQWFGPNGGTAYVPVEWSISNYNVIRTAVGNGIIVVEAAGNGSENLDAPIFSTGNGGHWPFLLANDSGAYIIGAGAAPASAGGSTTDRSRLSFSNYGATLDLQGWGERVTTTGYGGLYSAEGINLFYTSTFGGTSSASPIVASACVAVQGIHRAVTGGAVLTPAQLKAALQNTGSPQQSGAFPATQRIGPRPNVPAAVAAIFGNADCNANSIPDRVDIAMGLADVDGDLIPDVCQPCPADLNGDRVTDLADFFAFFGCYDLGQPCADIDGNPGVDLGDFFGFFASFDVGC